MKNLYFDLGLFKRTGIGILKGIVFFILFFGFGFKFALLAENMDFTKFSGQRDLLTFNGFMQNKGQIVDQEGGSMDEVRFLYKNKNFKCVLKDGGFSYELSHLDYKETETAMAKYAGLPEFARKEPEFKYFTHRIDVEFLNCNFGKIPESYGSSEDYFNYYLPQTGNEGARYVKYYEKVVYKDIYPNIDIEFYVTGTGIKYDIVIKPGGNIGEVRMKYRGHDDILAVGENIVRMNASEGFVEEKMGEVYSRGQGTGVQESVAGRFRLEGDVLSFDVGDYDRSKELVIDPEIVWGTYFGDIHREGINAVCTDELNNVIATGYTEGGANIATSGAYQTSYGGGSYDAFLVKFDYSGKRLWSTYFGGEKVDIGQGVAADNVWHFVFIMGYTSSTTGIASEGAWQEEYGRGYYDSFIAKFDLTGARMWSTYYGGSDAHALTGGEYIYAAAIDERYNDIYFTGVASSSNNIVSEGAHQTMFGGDFDAMLVKFNTDGEREWGTYVGGEGFDGAYGITLDPSGYITIGGYTDSDNSYWWGEELIASESAYKEYRSGGSDAFLARFNLRGTRQWGTYYGGSDGEIVYCLAADKDKNVYIGGGTTSSDGISTPGSHQQTKDEGTAGFIGKFSPTGNRLWGTYYGGDRVEEITGMISNKVGELKVIGYTNSENGIATAGSFQDEFVGVEIIIWDEEAQDSVSVGYYYDGFLASFEPNGTRQWGSYIGGGDDDQPFGVTLDMNGNIIIGGTTYSTYFIGTAGTYRSSYADTSDGFIMKVGDFVKIANISTPFCVGNQIQVSYETGREMNSGNVFTAQLSDSTGDFSSAVNIGTKSGTGNGIITATIPMNTVPASGYRIRVICSNPSKFGADNGSDLTIFGLPEPEILGDTVICSRGAEIYETMTSDGLFENRWYVSNGIFIGDSTEEQCVIRWNDVSQGVIKVVQRNTETECVDSTQRIVNINITPTVNIVGESEVVINSTESYRMAAQSFLNYYWEVIGGTINNPNTNNEIEVTWGGSGTGYVKLVITHKQTGCSDSLTMTIAINAVPIEINGKKTVCAFTNEDYWTGFEEEYSYKWVILGGVLQGSDTDSLVNIAWGEAGTGVIQIIRTEQSSGTKDTVVRNIKILQVPDVRILGSNEICGNDELLYIAVNTVGVTSEWWVYNGNIIGDATGDTVLVKWNDVAKGKDSIFVRGTLFLRQTSTETGCSFTKDYRVSISDNPDAIINGRFGVCEREIAVYRTEIENEEYTNRWFVERGTILGPPTDTIIQVEWGLAGKGKLKLIQTSGALCIDSNEVEVDINAMPARPLINQQGTTLVSSADEGNQWFTSDMPIEGAVYKEYTPKVSGYYSVQVTDEFGCQSQMSVPYFIEINKVIDYTTSQKLFGIFPNPTEADFKIVFYEKQNAKVSIKLRNIIGDLLLVRHLQGAMNNHQETIEFGDMPAGFYLIEILIGENKYFQKVVKF